MSETLTAIIINFKTLDLTRRATRSLRAFYPTLPLLLIDNGSDPATRDGIEELRREYADSTSLHQNPQNIFHGPAMDQGMHLVKSDFVLFIDSDCEILRAGLVEGMMELTGCDQSVYAVGHKIGMDMRGFDVVGNPGAIPYIRPYCMLVRRKLYLSLPPFVHHGAPCLENMREASRCGYLLMEFPVLDFVRHAGRGTAYRYGYHLGLRGIINHLLHKSGL
jgi:glycosyltransferase involved in cell wall biosynthesis